MSGPVAVISSIVLMLCCAPAFAVKSSSGPILTSTFPSRERAVPSTLAPPPSSCVPQPPRCVGLAAPLQLAAPLPTCHLHITRPGTGNHIQICSTASWLIETTPNRSCNFKLRYPLRGTCRVAEAALLCARAWATEFHAMHDSRSKRLARWPNPAASVRQ